MWLFPDCTAPSQADSPGSLDLGFPIRMFMEPKLFSPVSTCKKITGPPVSRTDTRSDLLHSHFSRWPSCGILSPPYGILFLLVRLKQV